MWLRGLFFIREATHTLGLLKKFSKKFIKSLD